MRSWSCWSVTKKTGDGELLEKRHGRPWAPRKTPLCAAPRQLKGPERLSTGFLQLSTWPAKGLPDSQNPKQEMLADL